MLIYTYIINIVIRYSFSPVYIYARTITYIYIHATYILSFPDSFLLFHSRFSHCFFPVRHYFPYLCFLHFAFLTKLAAYRGTYHLGWKITSRLSDTNHLFEARFTINFAYYGQLKKVFFFFYKTLQIIYARQIFTMKAISID